jgi:hypothetical protein
MMEEAIALSDELFEVQEVYQPSFFRFALKT